MLHYNRISCGSILERDYRIIDSIFRYSSFRMLSSYQSVTGLETNQNFFPGFSQAIVLQGIQSYNLIHFLGTFYILIIRMHSHILIFFYKMDL